MKAARASRLSAVAALLIALALAYLTLMLFVPLAVVLLGALHKGVRYYLDAVGDPDALAAVRLTLTAAGIAVPLNLAFGVAAAWAVATVAYGLCGRGAGAGISASVTGGELGSSVAAALRLCCIPFGGASERSWTSAASGSSKPASAFGGPSFAGTDRPSALSRLGALASRRVSGGAPGMNSSRTVAIMDVWSNG